MIMIFFFIFSATPLPLFCQAKASHATTSSVPMDESLPARVVRAVRALIGVPYSPGGKDLAGMDCSGLVWRVFADAADLDLPQDVEGLFGSGTAARNPLHKGDLLFFDTSYGRSPEKPTHVGIYAGGDAFVHAASEGRRRGVIESSLRSAYYRERFLGARRVIRWRPPVLLITVTDSPGKVLLRDPFASRENLTIFVRSEMTGGGPIELSLLKGGREVLWRRIVPTARRSAEVTLFPEVGEWTVRITRLYRGPEIRAVSFRVEE
jgi:hypothetical protein